MTRDEFIDAVWDEVIAGYPARDILAAWLRYLEQQGGSKYNRGHRRWFFSNWLPAKEAAALPQSPIRSAPDDTTIVWRRDTRAAVVPAEGRVDQGAAATEWTESVHAAADAFIRSVRRQVDEALTRAAGAQLHTTEDAEIEAALLMLMMMDED